MAVNLDEDSIYNEVLREYDSRHWMYFVPKVHCEKQLHQALTAAGIPSYLPLVRQTTAYTRRNYTRMVPLFPGYVFAAAERGKFDCERLRVHLLSFRCLSELDSRQLLTDLRIVRKYELLTGECRVTTSPLRRGMKVVIARGYFKGEIGVVERFVDREQVRINLQFLGVTMHVDMPLDIVKQYD